MGITVQNAQSRRKNDAARAERLARANINPATGLASDYLNHFNEAIMLLEMLGDCPECVDDFMNWTPKTYREHFANSHFKDRMIAVEAYDEAEPLARQSLEVLADTMNSILEATRAAMTETMPQPDAAQLAMRSASWLKPLVAHAGAVINGHDDASRELFAPQAAVDLLMKR
jgi:hypothetical protein